MNIWGRGVPVRGNIKFRIPKQCEKQQYGLLRVMGRYKHVKVVRWPIWYIQHSDAEFPSSLLKSSYNLSSQFKFLIIPNMISLLSIVQTQFYSFSETIGTVQKCHNNSSL